jgi:hypothetical protein
MEKILKDLEAWFTANGATLEADAAAVIAVVDKMTPSTTILGEFMDWAGKIVGLLQKIPAPDPTAGEG